MSREKPRILLVYIPCHLDFNHAVENARNLRRQLADINLESIDYETKILIVISVNGVGLSKISELEILANCDQLVYFEDPIGGDSNINQGFMKALEMHPDYFWILSANEKLVPGSIRKVFEMVNEKPESDIFVTNARRRSSTYQIKNVFLDVKSETALGLISGVIYNFSTTRRAFSAGPKFAWTGWGQLAVIQSACMINGKITITEIPDNQIYETPITDLGGLPKSSEFEVVRKSYAHSFFGMVVLIYAMFQADPKIRSKVLYEWLKQNWFKLHYFKMGSISNLESNSPHMNTIWVQQTATRILYKSGIRSRLLTFIGMNLKAERWKSINLFQNCKDRFYK